MRGYSHEQKQILEKLRPKLELISRRLSRLEKNRSFGSPPKYGGSTASSSKTKANGLEFVGHDIKFDARRVFDILDSDASGDVSFEELNVILGLNEVELKEFIRRMNEMSGSSTNSDSVTRPVFVKYFLQVLLETSKLTISFEEAEALFDEMAGSTEDKPVDEINMNKFYTSSMSDFLSDSQIFELIRVRNL
jgi:Ca2+-binding EF-hand superfamily protein